MILTTLYPDSASPHLHFSLINVISDHGGGGEGQLNLTFKYKMQNVAISSKLQAIAWIQFVPIINKRQDADVTGQWTRQRSRSSNPGPTEPLPPLSCAACRAFSGKIFELAAAARARAAAKAANMSNKLFLTLRFDYIFSYFAGLGPCPFSREDS